LAENKPRKPRLENRPHAEQASYTAAGEQASASGGADAGGSAGNGTPPPPGGGNNHRRNPPPGRPPQASRLLLLRILHLIRQYAEYIFGIKEGTDQEGTLRRINEGIELRGAAFWILMASVFIASIGLDTNSQAIIIGAMLISPLMAPILGIGLSVAIYDRVMLVRSLRNFGMATLLALLVSWFYFMITPLGEPTEQMTQRTAPTLLDVGVALFGGVAGIVANSRYSATNAIPGVAIATALLPPLSVAGYGLAHLNAEFFFGAFYLFFLNTVFISLATFLVTRYLQFPTKEHVNEAVRRRARNYILAFIVLVIIPSGWIFFRVIQDVRQQNNVEAFINQEVNVGEREALRYRVVQRDSTSELKLFMLGNLQQEELSRLQGRLSSYNLGNMRLRLIQPDDPEASRASADTELMRSLWQTNEDQKTTIEAKEEQIRTLRQEIQRLKGQGAFFRDLEQELRPLFPEMQSLTYAYGIQTNFEGAHDTIPVFLVDWEQDVDPQELKVQKHKLPKYLAARTKREQVKVIETD
jgi:uncharacterized hydrophobic protein (TIGR00271 family)